MHIRYAQPPADLFARNRKKFAERMKPGSAAVFFANHRVTVNADEHYKFQQDSNFYYLTGIDQEDCILFLFPDAPKEEWREVLFVSPTSEDIQIWEGWKFSVEEAKAAAGLKHVKMLNEFQGLFHSLVNRMEGVYVDINDHARNHTYTFGPAHRFAADFRNRFPAHALLRSTAILSYLRMFKEPEELAQLREAIRITHEAYERVLRLIRPGVMEYEVEAEVWHTFIRNRATGHAYEPIIAGGANAVVLHYNQNCKPLEEGKLVLLDFGASYGHYSADLTRTLPVSGQFTERQLAVYEAVLRVMKAAKARLKPGIQFQDYFKEAQNHVQDELLALGLLTQTDIDEATEEKPAFKKYFMHGLSHHLGLDTHDVGDYFMEVQAGMVFTIEPGIYIREEGLGIRLENNVLVTEGEPEDMMDAFALEPAEIIAKMAK